MKKGDCRDDSHLFSAVAAAIATAAVTTAFFCIRAANAFNTLFLLPDDIPGRQSYNQQDNSNNDIINHRHITFLRARIPCLYCCLSGKSVHR